MEHLEQKEEAFKKSLELLMTLAKKQGGVVSEDQIHNSFPEIELSLEQMEAIREYLKLNKVGIDEAVNYDDYITLEEKDYLTSYLTEISGIKQIMETEKQVVFLESSTGNPNAIEKMIGHFLPRVADIAKLYTGQGVLLEDLIGEGNMALTLGMQMLGEAVSFEEAEQILIQSVMNAMEQLIWNATQSDREDETFLQKMNRIAETAFELAQDLEREVLVSELAKEMDESEEVILECIKMAGGKIDGINHESE